LGVDGWRTFFLFPLRGSIKWNKYSELIGYFLIAASLFTISEKDYWPGYMALFPVCGVLLILFSNNQQSKVMGNAFVQWMGKISYSLYLWHWPIVVYISYLGLSDSLLYGVVGFLISIILGYASYEIVERKLTSYLSLNTIVATLISITPIVLISSTIFFTNGFISPLRDISLSDKALFIEKYNVKHQNLRDAYWLKCNAYDALLQRNVTDIDKSCIDNSGNRGVFLWGDSHAEALSYGLRTLLPKGVVFSQVTSAGCKPNTTESIQRGDLKVACDKSNQFALEKIAELKPYIVIIAQASQHELVDWEALSTKLKGLGVKHVILGGPLPQWLPSLPVVVAKRHWNEEKRISDSGLDRSIVTTNQVLRTKMSNGSLIFVNVFDELCSLKSNKYYCLVRIGSDDDLIAVDYGHLSMEGSEYVVKKLYYPHIKSLLTHSKKSI
jgi:hypothetical protein